MSEHLPSNHRPASSLPADRGELEASLSTVRLEELVSTLRRHLRLVVGVVATALAATGVVAYLTEPVYSAVAVIRLSDPRRALTGGVVDDPARADERSLLSQVQLLTSRAVAGAVIDSMPALRVLTTRNFPPSLLGQVAVAATAGPASFQLAFGRDSFVVRGPSGPRSAAYGTAVESRGIQFAVLRRVEASKGQLWVLSREGAISRLLARLRVRPRVLTDIVDVSYSAPDAQFAQQVVNRVVDIFRSTSAEAAQQQSRRRREFLEGQLKVNDSLLADARQALTTFRQRAGAYGSREALAREQIGLAGVELQRQELEAERRIAALNDLRTRQRQLSATDAEEARLTERVDNAQKVADELRLEYQKAGIAEAVTVGQVEIVDHATLPTKPAGIGLLEQLVLGLLVGLMLGTGGAFVAERGTRSIARRVEVEHLGLSVLGIVPRCGRAIDKKGPESADAAVEAFRSIRLNVGNAHGAPGPLVVAVTSPGSGDGKSFVCSNLALAFAHANHRTLLVDADLRRGALHRLLQLRRQPGLTDVLSAAASPERVLQTTTHPSLDFLASGSRRGDAPELLGSARMADFMTRLRSSYGVIVVDTPPLGAGVDALVLASLAGSLLMVLRLGKTDRELAEVKIDLLRQSPVRVLGAVLNDVREGSEYHAYGYYMDGYELTGEPLFRPLVDGTKRGRPPVTARK